jgi:hypothetical protein
MFRVEPGGPIFQVAGNSALWERDCPEQAAVFDTWVEVVNLLGKLPSK